MTKTIGIAKAREGFSELVNQVAFGGERYLVERRGKPLAALIGADEYRQLTELLAEAGVGDEVRGIPVRIRFDGSQYFCSDERLDLYGVGNSIDEAREDYWLAVQDYYADLSANADNLARPLQEHLSYLCKVLGEDES
jgi:prevent-host-death family protein